MKLYREGAVQAIKEVEPKARAFFANLEPCWRVEKDFGVTGSTFRAYRGFSRPPSSVYARWASNALGPLAVGLEKVSTRNEFLDLHARFANDLERFWEMEQGRPLSVGQKYKLLDLFLKCLSRSDLCGSGKETLVSFGNTPLDKFSLIAVKKLFYGIVLRNNPSMGDIDCPQTYHFIQEQIHALMEAAHLPNLYFDFFAWNVNHPGQSW